MMPEDGTIFPPYVNNSFKVLRMRLKDEAEGRFVSDLAVDLGLDFWNDLRVNAPTDVMVSPENLPRLLIALGIGPGLFV